MMTAWESLTDREWEVLAQLAQGKSNAQIAIELVIAKNTVKNHVNRILRKLDVCSRDEVIALFYSTLLALLVILYLGSDLDANVHE